MVRHVAIPRVARRHDLMLVAVILSKRDLLSDVGVEIEHLDAVRNPVGQGADHQVLAGVGLQHRDLALTGSLVDCDGEKEKKNRRNIHNPINLIILEPQNPPIPLTEIQRCTYFEALTFGKDLVRLSINHLHVLVPYGFLHMGNKKKVSNTLRVWQYFGHICHIKRLDANVLSPMCINQEYFNNRKASLSLSK